MIQIETSYSKKLGLPGFSSHAYSVTVRAEIATLRKLQGTSERLYQLLQTTVDHQLQSAGFVPEHGYAMNGSAAKPLNGSAVQPLPAKPADDRGDAWACSDKQRKFIEMVAKRERFTPADLENFAQRVCQAPVHKLDKRQASTFITELLNISAPLPFRKNGKRQAPAPAAAPA